MDDEFLYDIRKSLEDALQCNDWKSIEEIIDEIKEYQNDFDDDSDDYDD